MTFPATSSHPLPGEIVGGKYRIEQVLGQGGMGVVVRAVHTELGGYVALKFLNADVGRDPQVLARFLREARASAQIRSDHIAAVFDVGTLPNGAPYLVMELLEGGDLNQVLRSRGPLPVDEAVRYVLQAARAIAEAHRHGIVHRDLKPANLFLTKRSDGSPLVKVVDFGISKQLDRAAAGLTATSDMLGSPTYMSPEQIREPRSVDGRTDIWGLGTILYKLLLGHAPFAGETASGTLARIIADPVPPLRPERPEVSPELEAVVLRCLEKSRDNRYATAEELIEALSRLAPAANSAGSARLASAMTPHVGAMSGDPSTLATRVPSSASLGGPATHAAMLEPNGIFAGRYRVVRCIAAGGMGAIYEVVHLETERKRALKVMHPQVVQSADLRDRFRREAKVAAQIDSEFIVDVFDAGVDEPTQMPFLVMELLKGEELGKRLARAGRFAFPEALAYLWQTALALDVTHRASIVHRDLKPDNLFVVEPGVGPPRIKVLDFGVAKFMSETGKTQSFGTPLYMAPEQIRAGRITPAADIYALGLMAYTLLVGKPYWAPEAGAQLDLIAVAMLFAAGPKEPATRRAAREGCTLPPAFDRWFARATAVDPASRPPSATACISELGAVLGLDPERLTGMKSAPRAEIDAQPSLSTSATALSAVGNGLATASAPVLSLDTVGKRSSSVPVIVLVSALGIAAATFAAFQFAEPSKPTEPAVAVSAAPAPSAVVVAAPTATPPVVTPSSSASVAAPSASVAPPPPKPISRPKPVRPPPAPKAACNPPYTVDANGDKHAKPGCI